MAISTFAELKLAVAGWINRTDLTATIPDFVTLAESEMRGDLRIRDMEALASGTLTGETLAHPDYFIDARRLTVEGKNYDYRTAQEYQLADDNGSVQRIFTSIGRSFYILNGAQGDAYTLVYRAGLTPLVSSSDSNWVLLNAPDVYLWGACKQAAIYLKDAAALAQFGGLYQSAVLRTNDREKRASVSGSPLQMSSVSQE